MAKPAQEVPGLLVLSRPPPPAQALPASLPARRRCKLITATTDVKTTSWMGFEAQGNVWPSGSWLLTFQAPVNVLNSLP